MPQQPLDYRSVLPTSGRSGVDAAAIAATVFGIAALLLNILLLYSAEVDPGLGGIGWLMFLSPIVNGIMLLLGLALAFIFKRRSTSLSFTAYMLAAVAFPVVAAAFNLYFLTVMRRY